MRSYTKIFGIILGTILLLPILINASSDSSETYCCPQAPTDLKVVSRTDQSITLEWRDNSWDEEGFIIERCSYVDCSVERSHFGEYDQVPENTTIYRDDDVYLNVIYYYRVKSYKSYDVSGYSNIVSTSAQPDSPYVIVNCMIDTIMPDRSSSCYLIPLILIGIGIICVKSRYYGINIF